MLRWKSHNSIFIDIYRSSYLFLVYRNLHCRFDSKNGGTRNCVHLVPPGQTRLREIYFSALYHPPDRQRNGSPSAFDTQHRSVYFLMTLKSPNIKKTSPAKIVSRITCKYNEKKTNSRGLKRHRFTNHGITTRHAMLRILIHASRKKYRGLSCRLRRTLNFGIGFWTVIWKPL